MVLLIAPLVTWKIRASCAGVFSPPSRAKWFSTMKCDSSMPRGSTRVETVLGEGLHHDDLAEERDHHRVARRLAHPASGGA